MIPNLGGFEILLVAMILLVVGAAVIPCGPKEARGKDRKYPLR